LTAVAQRQAYGQARSNAHGQQHTLRNSYRHTTTHTQHSHMDKPPDDKGEVPPPAHACGRRVTTKSSNAKSKKPSTNATGKHKYSTKGTTANDWHNIKKRKSIMPTTRKQRSPSYSPASNPHQNARNCGINNQSNNINQKARRPINFSWHLLLIMLF
jgi:hypothetical protein